MKQRLNATQKSTILAMFAGAGVLATGTLSAWCAKRAEKKKSIKEKIIAYAPSIGAGAATIGCIAASTYISSAEIASLTVACAAIVQRFANYRQAVHETVDAETEDRINEVYYLNEIDRLEQELAEREHPRDDDDWCIFTDSFTPYSFKAPYEQVEAGIEAAKKLYEKQGYLCWCDIFYLANNGDTVPYDSILGSDYTDYGVGWSKGMFDQLFEDTDYDFDICLVPVKGKENAYVIEYSTIPEPCFMEY